MLKRVKKWLGIEGVKIEIVVPEVFEMKEKSVFGKLLFTSLHEQTITSYHIKLVEKYTRGRRKRKLTDEYTLGEKTVNKLITVLPEEAVEVYFEMPFEPMHSPVEAFGEKNVIFGSLSKAAKFLKGAKSEYRLEVEADVTGTALNPYKKEVINFK